MATFLFVLKTHPMVLIAEYGKRVMLQVQVSVRRLWRSLLGAPRDFGISVLNDDMIERTAAAYIRGLQYAEVGSSLLPYTI